MCYVHIVHSARNNRIMFTGSFNVSVCIYVMCIQIAIHREKPVGNPASE